MLACSPSVLLVVPVLNEANHIRECLQSLVVQNYTGPLNIAVFDGGSEDDTVKIALEFSGSSRVTVSDNPRKIQSAAMNLAATSDLEGQILMRADAHSVYKQDFVSNCVQAMLENEAESVVVPMLTVGKTNFQRAVAAAQNSLLGNGGSAHRRPGISRYVDHGHHAAFERAFFLRLGGYSDEFTHNEDAEYDRRVIANGGRIWLCREAAIEYYPRSTPAALARQYNNYGRGRAKTILRHRTLPKIRQLAPLGIVSSIGLSILLAPIFSLAVLVPVGYGLVYVGWSIVAAVKRRDTALLAMGIAAFIMHANWARGFVGALAAHARVGHETGNGTTTCNP